MSDFLAACPINGKRCCDGIREDFTAKHPLTKERLKCVEWINLQGTHPQTGKQLDNWTCQRVAVPILLVENSNQQRQTAASVDKVANQIHRHRAEFIGALTDDARERLMLSAPQVTPEGTNGTPR